MSIARIKECFESKHVDACLLTSKDPNFFYATQEPIGDALLLILKNAKPQLLLSPLEHTGNKAFTTIKITNVEKTLKDLFEKHSIHWLGINERSMSLALYNKINPLVSTRDISEELSKIRSIKSKHEIAIMREGCKITTNIVNSVIQELKKKKHKTEADIKRSLAIKTLQADATFSFEPIVASGQGGATPHYTGNKKLHKGFLIIDFGIKYKGYCTDMTRTLYLGTPTKKEKDIYAAVLACQEACINYVSKNYKSKLTGKDIQLFAEQQLGAHAKYFTHAIGHGLGIEVHEHPGVSHQEGQAITPGMVITIEPGYYNLFGIRIEDDIYLGDKVENLTRGTPKKLTIC